MLTAALPDVAQEVSCGKPLSLLQATCLDAKLRLCSVGECSSTLMQSSYRVILDMYSGSFASSTVAAVPCVAV